jgi:tetratricopeptide (TPR) repeat protein
MELPDESEAIAQAIQLYEKGRFDQCLAVASTVLARPLGAKDRRALMRLSAEASIELDRFSDAIRFYNNIAAEAPSVLDLNNRAFAWKALGDYSAAEKDYQEVLSYEPSFPSAVAGLAECYLKQGRIDDAIDVISERANPDDRHSWTWSLLGDAWLRLRKFGKAYKSFRLAIAFDPKDEYPRRRLAAIEALVSDKSENEQSKDRPEGRVD